MPLTCKQQLSVFEETVVKKSALPKEYIPLVRQAFFFGTFFMLNAIQELSATHQTEEGLKKAIGEYQQEILDYAQVPPQDRLVQ
jgi:hypothetical protein